MEDVMAEMIGGGAALVLLVLCLIIAVYPLLALGRIWFYSKQQVQELRRIREALANQAR
jgi:hypothetical protein